MTVEIANVDMAAAWDGEEGDDWARDWKRYDRSIQRYQNRLLAASEIGANDHVLDVGCGNGESTRAAARVAVDGSALGIDLSTRMIERARELAASEGLANVAFERADAQVHAFEPNVHDVVISRFGAMFFADRIAAFRNICPAIRPDGRLVVLAWQELERNEWLVEIRAALAAGRELPIPPPGVPGPFGLADPEGVKLDLHTAGFAQVAVEAVEEPVWAGSDADDAFLFFRNTGVARGLLQDLDDAARASAVESLKETMVAHQTGDGVKFGSAAWLITARRS
ncbi:MAG TPA: methyltransferase domain-containing protein [Actinomycetota bacterium]|nr:methyltransferase domain-containing protein [Actinomycetota bacterium]